MKLAQVEKIHGEKVLEIYLKNKCQKSQYHTLQKLLGLGLLGPYLHASGKQLGLGEGNR